MKIYLMRHGKTLQNAHSYVQGGGSDSPLTNDGISRTLKAKEIIDTLGIERIYSGNLGRHLETVKLINTNNIEHIIDPNLNEALFGGFENTPIWLMYLKTFISAKYFGSPKNLSINFIMDSIKKADKTHSVESSSEILIRVDKAMDKILKCNLDSILIVSSGMYLETLISKYNRDIKFMRMKNCGIYCLDTNDNLKVSTIYE